jgi:putative component of toxin-antitoxin plasmid stabilization module
LKKILRELFEKQLQDADLMRQALEVESRIDRLALVAFDSYMACREKINDLKANETRSRTFKAFERAGLIKKDPEQVPDA